MSKQNSKNLFEELAKEIVAFRDGRDWERYQNPKNIALGILIEAGELAEYFHYLEGEELKNYIAEFKKEIGEELSDVLYWVLLMAHDLDIDLLEAFRDKMKKNGKKYPPGKNIGKAFKRLEEKRAQQQSR